MNIIETTDHNIETEFDVAKVSIGSSKLAQKIGFSSSKQNIVATIVSELGKNILHHAQHGSITLNIITDEKRIGIEIHAIDQGPGIEDIALAMTDHYSTRHTLGLGLSAIKRMSDDLKIDTEIGKGTHVIATKWVK